MNQLRIIGGQWKRRNIAFESVEGLRPTPDRLRETIFNWLMWDLTGARVLDVCAGSGALGIEALSRGAVHAVLIEPHVKQAKQLQQVLQALLPKSTEEMTSEFMVHMTAEVIPRTAQQAKPLLKQQTFNLMFLDPPYALNLWAELAQLYDDVLDNDAIIYVEADRPLDSLNLPSHWEIYKQTKTGVIYAGLFKKTM